MMSCRQILSARCIGVFAVALCAAFAAHGQPWHAAVHLHLGPNAAETEHRYAEILEERLEAYGVAEVYASEQEPPSRPWILHAGTQDSYPELRQWLDRLDAHMPGPLDPGQEGYVLATGLYQGRDHAVIVGADTRGVLYGMGELLRRVQWHEDGVRIQRRLHLRHAPRWRFRGLNVLQGHTMRELTGAREWTQRELERAYIEYALAGANTFRMRATDHEMHAFVKSLGLMTMATVSGNAGQGPPEWQAKEAIGRTGYLSPAIPEARAALLEQREKLFQEMPAFDVVHIKSGDGGGDESEAAQPYGKFFIELCEDYARLLHQYHPETLVFVGNQKLDNAGDEAIFAYLNEEPRDWCAGIVYGPGSNAMGWTPGRRQDHRMDLFEYARTGALSGYLRYSIRRMPMQQDILLFTDLTHWVYSQYGLMDHEIIPDRNHDVPPQWDYWMYERRPSEAMAMVYDRRAFHARPRDYYEVFQQTTPYALGDVAYSEGHHDHLNQWIYQRLFWHPHRGLSATVDEYARVHFGPEAAPTMRQAIFQLEENLQRPIVENDGIERLIDLVEKARMQMPEYRRQRDYLWRQYAQRAYLDSYIKTDVRRQRAMLHGALGRLEKAMDTYELPAVISELSSIRPPDETPILTHRRRQATQLGEESELIYGVRNAGLFNLKHDYVGFGWLRRQLQTAASMYEPAAQRETISRIVHYEDAGEGGFYDNAGVPGGAPRLVYGWPYGDGIFSGANRPSQRTMAFTTDEEQGVTFRYKDLDPKAQYRVRMTLVRPRHLPRFGKFQFQTSQSIYADDIPLAEHLELPEYEADFFTFDVPKEATADGELILTTRKQPGVGEGAKGDVTVWRNTGGWGTLVSEVWLIKKPPPS